VPTKTHVTSRRAAVALLLSGLVAALVATTAPDGSAHGNASFKSSPLRVVATTLSMERRSWSYDWPLKPFDRQHPIRAFFNDPRIGHNGGQAFHFGIDISAPDGTAVYAVEGGTVYFDSPRAIAVVAPDRSHSFGYWHIVPVVKSHQIVCRHQLLGHIDHGWEHVHFAERRGGEYVNPLRNGALGPYADRTAPTVAQIAVVGFDLVATAYDTPDPRVPGGWANEPVTPALLLWRIVDSHGVGAWRTAADFRAAMLPRSDFRRIYTPATRQNHRGEPGRFSFYLRRGWSGRNLVSDTIIVQVEARDSAGNSTLASEQFTLAT
jgi:hypothetical protein